MSDIQKILDHYGLKKGSPERTKLERKLLKNLGKLLGVIPQKRKKTH